MQCPYCNYKESKVIDSRHTDLKSIRRRRECESCKKRFTTYEKIETTPLMVIKKDNSREYFDREKIKYGLLKACEKRPVSIDEIESIVVHIENEINKCFIEENPFLVIDQKIFNERIKILNQLIVINDNWETYISKMDALFLKDQRRLELKISKIKNRGNDED